jgi:hypothetical protein
VRRGMEGMKKREKGKNVKKKEILKGESVKEEGVLEMNVMMVISVFERKKLKEGNVIVVVKVNFSWMIRKLRDVWNVYEVE